MVTERKERLVGERINAGSTPFDDVFRTLVVDHRRMLLAFINEMFPSLPEKYNGDEVVVPLNEQYQQNRQDGEQDKRIVDSAVMVIDHSGNRRIFHVESQSTEDGNIIVRMFEYDMQIALKTTGEYTPGKLRITVPHSGILFLRCTEGTPDEMTVELLLPNGREVSYSMPVLKMIRYDDDTIFEKKLYFLVPFYLFNLEHYFKNRIEIADEDKASYDKELMSFKQKLVKALENKNIDTYTYRSLIDLFNKVVAALTVGKDSVWEETEAIMGGQVLDYEAKSILNEGVIKGTVEEAQFYGATFEATVDRISAKFNLKEDEAEEAVSKYWK